MISDAIAAETYKFWRNRNAVFWGFCLVPLAVLLFNLGLQTWLKLHHSGTMQAIMISAGHRPTVNLGAQILHSLSLSGSSFAQIFYAVGAASLFASEYRWETWRLITPRNSRFNLWTAKYAVYAVACAASLIALVIVGVLHTLYGAVLTGASLTTPDWGIFSPALITFFSSWAELLILGALVGLVAAVSRAMIGALLAGVVFSFAQTIAMGFVRPWEAPLRDFAILPSMSAYVLRAWAAGQQIAPDVYTDKVLPSVLFLVMWIVVVAGASIMLFQHQDLPRE